MFLVLSGGDFVCDFVVVFLFLLLFCGIFVCLVWNDFVCGISRVVGGAGMAS